MTPEEQAWAIVNDPNWLTEEGQPNAPILASYIAQAIQMAVDQAVADADQRADQMANQAVLNEREQCAQVVYDRLVSDAGNIAETIRQGY